MRGLKRRGRGTCKEDKPPVITIVERKTGKTILSVEKNLSKQLIQEKLEKHCIKPVKLFTDDYTIYSKLEEHHQVKEHHIINHSEKEYADGENHVNNAENRHSLLRPFLNMFRGVSKKNLNTYVKFFQFTFNNGINWLEKALKIILKQRTIS
ncbi:MAG: IS1595 family transposase, partial [Methanobacterium sp.]|nr:IS1595 family transposase [Methanobacterium sp.]